MEGRHSRRIIVRLKAECISGHSNNAVFIENISEDGMYMITTPAKTPIAYIPGTILELKPQFPSGETLHLHCRVVWSYKTPPHGLTDSVGVEIIDPPPKYKEFLKTL